MRALLRFATILGLACCLLYAIRTPDEAYKPRESQEPTMQLAAMSTSAPRQPAMSGPRPDLDTIAAGIMHNICYLEYSDRYAPVWRAQGLVELVAHESCSEETRAALAAMERQHNVDSHPWGVWFRVVDRPTARQHVTFYEGIKSRDLYMRLTEAVIPQGAYGYFVTNPAKNGAFAGRVWLAYPAMPGTMGMGTFLQEFWQVLGPTGDTPESGIFHDGRITNPVMSRRDEFMLWLTFARLENGTRPEEVLQIARAELVRHGF